MTLFLLNDDIGGQHGAGRSVLDAHVSVTEESSLGLFSPADLIFWLLEYRTGTVALLVPGTDY